jgi:uncharacterized lipoprotein YehR (DUF1307 family)
MKNNKNIRSKNLFSNLHRSLFFIQSSDRSDSVENQITWNKTLFHYFKISNQNSIHKLQLQLFQCYTAFCGVRNKIVAKKSTTIYLTNKSMFFTDY